MKRRPKNGWYKDWWSLSHVYYDRFFVNGNLVMTVYPERIIVIAKHEMTTGVNICIHLMGGIYEFIPDLHLEKDIRKVRKLAYLKYAIFLLESGG